MVKLAIGKAAGPYSDYFDRCRRKRNLIDYDDAFVSTETEVKEILTKAKDSRIWSNSGSRKIIRP